MGTNDQISQDHVWPPFFLLFFLHILIGSLLIEALLVALVVNLRSPAALSWPVGEECENQK